MLLSQSDIKYEIDTTSYPGENTTHCVSLRKCSWTYGPQGKLGLLEANLSHKFVNKPFFASPEDNLFSK